MIKTLLIAETRLDRAAFLLATRQLTGQNHALEADRKNLPELPGDLDILDNFAGKPIADALTSVGFLLAGPADEVDAFLEQTRGLPHLSVDNTFVPHYAKAVVVSGSLFHWVNLIVEGCRRNRVQVMRDAYTQMHHQLCSRGLHGLFEGYRQAQQQDGTILLLPSN